MMKQIKLNFFSALTMALLVLSATAHDFEVDGIYYNINGSEATVTYKGTLSSSYDDEYTGSVNIPASVTYGGTTYYVTAIGNSAFSVCSELTNVTIPNTVTTIGIMAFYRSGLTSVTIPNTITTVGLQAFAFCTGLASIIVDNGNPIYDSRNNCNAIIETASNTLIAGCKKTTIPNSVTSIGDEAFAFCTGLTNIAIPNSVTSIGEYAFQNCTRMTSITIPNSITSIGRGVFYNCRYLTSVTIPNSVNVIGEATFQECSGLTSIDIPNSVTAIENYAFSGCSGLTSIAIPNSVTSIGNSAFSGCSGLTSITIGNSVTTIGEKAFINCSELSSVDIPNSVTSIGNSAFSRCSGLTSVNVPNSVTSIGNRAFQNCSGMTSVIIGNSVTSIGDYAFSDCSELTSVTCLAANPPTTHYYTFPSEVTSQATLYVPRGSVTAYQKANYWKNFSQIVGIPETPAIDDFEVDGVWYQAVDENTAMVISRSGEDEYYSGDVVIPEEVTYEGYTFAVISINTGAFEDCYELNSVVIGDAVESIGENAFQGCSDLTSMTIGSGVTNIGAKAFNYCNVLQTVTCRGTVPPVMASSNCFSTATYNRAKLVVPRPEIETYAATDYWYKFSHIEGWGYLGPGDVNGSGTIDMDDLTRLINIMLTDDLGGIEPAWADVTGNGIVSMNDLTELINLLLNQ